MFPEKRDRFIDANFGKLFTFFVLGRFRSFTVAAKQLGITTSAISHRIKHLESQFSCVLVDRTQSGFSLTARGQKLYNSLMPSMNNIYRSVFDVSVMKDCTIYLHSHPSIGLSWLPKVIKLYKDSHPNVSLNISLGNQMMRDDCDDVDISLTYEARPRSDKISSFLIDESLAPVCTPDYAERYDLHNNPEKLKYTHILHDRAAWVDATADSEWTFWAERAETKFPASATYSLCDTSLMCLMLAKAGCGIAMGRKRIVSEMLEDGSLIKPFGEFISTDRSKYVVSYNNFSPGEEYKKELVEYIKKFSSFD